MTGAEVRRLLPLQAGGLLGPMAGTGVVTLIPALSTVYAVSPAAVALAITVYMIPFAAVQLFSGSISQLVGGRRTAIVGFAGFGLASLACALAPGFPLFLAFRFVQGVGAAFLFPILLALVGEVVAPERLGRAIGAFGVGQTLGLTLGPLLAGLIEVSWGWRWFFVLLGVAALASGLAFARLSTGDGERPPEPASVWALTRMVLRRPAVLLLSLAAAGLFFAMIGPYTYLAVWLKAVAAIGEDRIGLVLGLAGAVGIPASAMAGRWVDRYGRTPVGVAALAGYITALLGLAAVPYSFAATLGLAAWLGWTGAVAWIALNTLAVELCPPLRKPVASVYNAFRFLGYSLAPPLLGLVYGDGRAGAVYLVSAGVAALAACCIGAVRPARAPVP